MLFLDGVYIKDQSGKLHFKQLPKPGIESLQSLLHTISHRIAHSLERKGLLERDIENTYLQLDGMEADSMQCLYGPSAPVGNLDMLTLCPISKVLLLSLCIFSQCLRQLLWRLSPIRIPGLLFTAL